MPWPGCYASVFTAARELWVGGRIRFIRADHGTQQHPFAANCAGFPRAEGTGADDYAGEAGQALQRRSATPQPPSSDQWDLARYLSRAACSAEGQADSQPRTMASMVLRIVMMMKSFALVSSMVKAEPNAGISPALMHESRHIIRVPGSSRGKLADVHRVSPYRAGVEGAHVECQIDGAGDAEVGQLGGIAVDEAGPG